MLLTKILFFKFLNMFLFIVTDDTANTCHKLTFSSSFATDDIYQSSNSGKITILVQYILYI